MPRRRRIATSGIVYHVLNRGARRLPLFETRWDYAAFEQLIFDARIRSSVRVFAYTVMPNHWHLIVSPDRDGELSRFMHWLTCTHAQRWHAHRGSSGTGAVYQGRFKAIPVQSDCHLLWVCRYVERNPLRANLVDDATKWRWSSLWLRENSCDSGRLDLWPVLRSSDWADLVNQPQTEAEVSAIRDAIVRGRPVGCPTWVSDTARRLSLESSLRPAHRPSTKGLPTPFSHLSRTTTKGGHTAPRAPQARRGQSRRPQDSPPRAAS